jgi:hypothetical protein
MSPGWRPFVTWTFNNPCQGRKGFYTERGLEVHSWFAIVVFGVLPLFWTIQRFKFSKRYPTGCIACGYNLTGNASGTCPECGTVVPNSAL